MFVLCIAQLFHATAQYIAWKVVQGEWMGLRERLATSGDGKLFTFYHSHFTRVLVSSRLLITVRYNPVPGRPVRPDAEQISLHSKTEECYPSPSCPQQEDFNKR